MNARFSPLVREARSVVRQATGIEAAPLYVRRVFGNEIHLEYALGRKFVLDFRGISDHQYRDEVRLELTRFDAMLPPENAPAGGWKKFFTSALEAKQKKMTILPINNSGGKVKISVDGPEAYECEHLLDYLLPYAVGRS